MLLSPRSSGTQTAAATISLHNQNTSAQTVRSHLREAHLPARRPHQDLDLVCGCQCCESSGPWWRWGRRMLWTTNKGAFYWWHFECTDIPWRKPEAYCCAIHPRPSPHIAAWYVAPCCKDLYAISGSWKHPSSCMASMLTGHVTHWACLGCSVSAYTTVCSSSCQYPATSYSHWRGVDQQSTDHNQQPDQLDALREANVGHTRYWLVFGPPNTLKLQLLILEWPFIVASLRHTCAITMLSNQHLDMPHLWGGWIISAKEKCSLTPI